MNKNGDLMKALLSLIIMLIALSATADDKSSPSPETTLVQGDCNVKLDHSKTRSWIKDYNERTWIESCISSWKRELEKMGCDISKIEVPQTSLYHEYNSPERMAERNAKEPQSFEKIQIQYHTNCKAFPKPKCAFGKLKEITAQVTPTTPVKCDPNTTKKEFRGWTFCAPVSTSGPAQMSNIQRESPKTKGSDQ